MVKTDAEKGAVVPPILEVSDLSVGFSRYIGLTGRRYLPCLTGVSARVDRGQVLGVVGVSGAGKSLLAHAILGILPGNAVVGGEIRFEGEILEKARSEALRGRRIALVPQSIAHLDPLVRAGRQVRWAALRAGISPSHAGIAAQDALARYRLPAVVADFYPHMLSGGMARRVLLAMATVASADLIIADEPTTGLDPTNVQTVMTCLRTLADRGKAVMVITHDICSVAAIADNITIIRAGQTVETASAKAFYGRGEMLATEYGRCLWCAVPDNGFTLGPIVEGRMAGE